MSPQISEQIKATPPALASQNFKEIPTGMPVALNQRGEGSVGEPPLTAGTLILHFLLGLSFVGMISVWLHRNARKRYWNLIGLAVFVNAWIAVIACVLVFSDKYSAPSEKTKIRLAFADRPEVLDGFRRWVVQEGGRQKPFETFCRETMTTVSGTEKFEGNDPIAVVLSWMMTNEVDRSVPGSRPSTLLGDQLGTDWEHHAFILCDYKELREIIYRDTLKPGEKLAEKLEGKYVEPARLRSSTKFNDLAERPETKHGKNEKAEITELETKAEEVSRRLGLFDQTSAGSRFGVVALDDVGNTWFPLAHVKHLIYPPAGMLAAGETSSSLWDTWLTKERREKFEQYRGKPVQAYPDASARSTDAAFSALRESYLKGARAYAALENALAADQPPPETALETMRTEYKTASDQFGDETTKFLTIIADVSLSHRSSYPDNDTVELELAFNRLFPFRKAWIFALIATVLLGATVITAERSPRLSRGLYLGGMLGYVGALGIAIYGFYCRVAISGRPPVSNMYETIVWVGLMAGVFGLILELIYRRGFIALAGALVATINFVLADRLPLTFSPSIEPLTAVLRSQYWLIIHVLTIVSSYAAFALAWGLGNINLGLIVFSPHRQDLIKTLSHYSYKAIQVGVVLIFAGTMLGGWWAAESWGRFWGWDPKEVWALIALLCYIIPLHMRYVGWIKDFGLAACSVICFASVVMAWYGVNFILGAGLHSYGFGSGNNWWVYLAGITNISLVIHAGIRYTSRQIREA